MYTPNSCVESKAELVMLRKARKGTTRPIISCADESSSTLRARGKSPVEVNAQLAKRKQGVKTEDKHFLHQNPTKMTDTTPRKNIAIEATSTNC